MAKYKFISNDDRLASMVGQVDTIKAMYIDAGVFVNEGAVLPDEEHADYEGSSDDGDMSPSSDENKEECDTSATSKPKRYYYFGFLLYPTKNERHYQIFNRIPHLGCSYAMVFHYKEFYQSAKRIQRKCFLQGDIRTLNDIIFMKSKGDVFVDIYGSGEKLRLIEPHCHVLIRWDNKISVASMARILHLEENLIKFKSTDGKFLGFEFNILNYMIHLGRSHYKFNKTYLLKLNTVPEDDMQDRCDYSVDEVVACPKWYNLLLKQADEFGDLRAALFADFQHWLVSCHYYVFRQEVIAWFSDKTAYSSYWTSNKQYVRTDLIKIVEEHNLHYSLDPYSDVHQKN